MEAWDPETIDGKCCFHDDKEAGSFKYTDNGAKGGVFTCFCCGETGDKIDFVMKHDKVDFKEANLRIAARFGLIEESEYKKVSKNPSTGPIIKKEIKPKVKINESKRFPNWYLNNFYRDIAKLSGLSNKHKEYLLGRGVKENELEDYFTLKPFNEKFFKLIEEKYGYHGQDFLGVPGFYYENRQVKGRDVRGIGILLKDTNDMVRAVQIRKDGKLQKGEIRYSFLSSTGFNFGCSCGAPADVVKPDCTGSVFITEGHFKAYRITDHFHKTAISVQGVNNTKCLDEIIPELLEKRAIRRFIIAFDADLMRKPEVKKAAIKLQKKLSKYEIPVRFMVWDEKYGKGADDVIINGNADKFQIVDSLKED